MRYYQKPDNKCPKGSFSYAVKSGDTLYKLAKMYNTTVEEILELNPDLDPYNVQIGEKICIPEDKPEDCPKGTFSYKIKSGDTLYQLAKKYDTTVEEILEVNPDINPYNLQVGQEICIPKQKEPQDCDGMYYVVRPGDTLYLIAQKYGISVEEILEANPNVDPYNLQIGQLICVPKKEKPKPKPCPGGHMYKIRKGDSLTSILMKFNISIMDLKEGNPNIDLDNLKAGQEICILPHKDRGCPCPYGSNPYIIKKSDNPGDKAVVVVLAKKFNTSVDHIMKSQ